MDHDYAMQLSKQLSLILLNQNNMNLLSDDKGQQ
jgi:hypothetical protein